MINYQKLWRLLHDNREGKLVLAYRAVTQDTCPHDAKVKMAGFKDRYECTRCQKIIQYVPSDKKSDGKNE